jgi:Cu+-exporting ATPase
MLAYNVLGKLTPLVAAILMPLSSISVVGFVPLGIFILARKLK